MHGREPALAENRGYENSFANKNNNFRLVFVNRTF